MSSFLGHGLAAAAIPARPNEQAADHRQRLHHLLWFGWLIVLSWVPDIDHAVPALSSGRWDGVRITHSAFAALALPLATVAVVSATPTLRSRRRCLEATMAGLSHILLDYLVGVHPLPLLWPLTDTGTASHMDCCQALVRSTRSMSTSGATS